MAVDVVAPALARPRVLTRVAAIPANALVAAIVAASFVIRELAALAHVTPYMVPDEYYYSTLARSIATSGHPLIRGHGATSSRASASRPTAACQSAAARS